MPKTFSTARTKALNSYHIAQSVATPLCPLPPVSARPRPQTLLLPKPLSPAKAGRPEVRLSAPARSRHIRRLRSFLPTIRSVFREGELANTSTTITVFPPRPDFSRRTPRPIFQTGRRDSLATAASDAGAKFRNVQALHCRVQSRARGFRGLRVNAFFWYRAHRFNRGLAIRYGNCQSARTAPTEMSIR